MVRGAWCRGRQGRGSPAGDMGGGSDETTKKASARTMALARSLGRGGVEVRHIGEVSTRDPGLKRLRGSTAYFIESFFLFLSIHICTYMCLFQCTSLIQTYLCTYEITAFLPFFTSFNEFNPKISFHVTSSFAYDPICPPLLIRSDRTKACLNASS